MSTNDVTRITKRIYCIPTGFIQRQQYRRLTLFLHTFIFYHHATQNAFCTVLQFFCENRMYSNDKLIMIVWQMMSFLPILSCLSKYHVLKWISLAIKIYSDLCDNLALPMKKENLLRGFQDVLIKSIWLPLIDFFPKPDLGFSVHSRNQYCLHRH